MHGQPSIFSSLSVLVIFNQQFAWNDLFIVALLVVLEGLLSLDNAMVLGVLARRLPHAQQSRALLYGLVGAFVFRLVAIALAAYLLHWKFLKLLGGLYLLWVALKHFFFGSSESHSPGATNESTAGLQKFWSTVVAIEFTDIAFAVDSIIAAIALIGPLPPGYAPGAIHPRLWIVVLGGFLGVVLMRFAAAIFIRLLERFARLEVSAYLIVAIIGVKMLLDWYLGPGYPVVTWIFWIVLIGCFLGGFIPAKSALKN